MTMHRRQALQRGLAGGLVLALPFPMLAAGRSAPFRRLAVLDPPYEEAYEVLIAMAPPLARGTVAKVLTRLATEADVQLKTDQLTAALDPDKTRLHEHFVHALADALDAADAKVLLVPTEPAEDEDALMHQVQALAPQADGLLLANVMGRFVALHGLDAYAPGVIAGIKALPMRGGTPWLDTYFSAGFRGIDPRAEHLEVVDMPERFDNHTALLDQVDAARQSLVRGAEAIAAEVAQRLMA
ncbi:MAG: hypothetical protein A3E25_09665 [Burkholderiales bacterium RIFCSPHIGHO2_12_FULL_69_20]|nr:MAG: hypothetical protein A3E25_09665 [Burkholderiales bacterium RIFCSPHIGHO2_12_FULL_69_20]